MRLLPWMTLACLWQSALVVDLQAPARPEHLRYQRSLAVFRHGSGMACATLDTTALAHTASPAHNDLRVFRQAAGEAETEVPYTLTESGPEPLADTAVTPEHLEVQGDQVRFDLRMPARPYSEVRLGIASQDFVATATVEGADRAGRRVPLGSVGLYDLSRRQLGRWTSILLAETTEPLLHITLDLRRPDGSPYGPLPSPVVRTAEVPPSRLRQTRYVPTVSTAHVVQEGQLSVARLRVPAHVPVERVLFSFRPGTDGNFAREITVSARADGAPITDTEALDAGLIEHLRLASGDPRLYPLVLREDAVDATLGATLERPATVLVAVDNGTAPPLPIDAVTLEMRERRLCFFADREGSYILRYGDPALRAPEYDTPSLTGSTEPLTIAVGPEERNPRFHIRPASRNLWRDHPELFWALLLFSAGMVGGTTLHFVQHRRS